MQTSAPVPRFLSLIRPLALLPLFLVRVQHADVVLAEVVKQLAGITRDWLIEDPGHESTQQALLELMVSVRK